MGPPVSLARHFGVAHPLRPGGSRSPPLYSLDANRPIRLPRRCRQVVSLRPTRGRIDGSVHYFVGGADHALSPELGNCLAVLLPAPVDGATLVYDNRRPEELVQ